MPGEEIAVIPSVGGGDGGGGAAVEETPAAGSEEEVPLPSGGEGGGEGGEGGGEERAPGDTSTDEHPERDDIETDGRKMDQRTRDALKKFAATDPEAAKVVRDAYYAKQSVLKEFPEQKDLSGAIRSIRTMKATLEAAGGDEGIQNLQSKVTDYDREIEQFANGDRGLIEQLHEGNPEGVAMAAANSLDLLSEKSPGLFEKALTPSLAKFLTAAEWPKYIKETLDACTAGDGQAAYNAVAKMAAWMQKLDKAAGDIAKNRTQVDPRTKEIEERETALRNKEMQAYDREINNAVTVRNNSAMEKITRQFFKDVGLDGKDKGPGRRDFTQGLMNRVFAAMREDASYMRLAKSIKAKGDAEKTAQFAADKFEEVLPDVFQEFKSIRYPNMRSKPSGGKPNGKAAPETPGKAATPAGGSATASVVTKVPAPDTVDWSKTPDSMYHVGRGWGEAVLKSGKKVKWQWETATP